MAKTILPIESLNFHLTKRCNMHCKHCFAHFRDSEVPAGLAPLNQEERLAIIDMLAESNLSKINFTGGEPLLEPWIDQLLARAKGYGWTSCLGTNGFLLTPQWLDSVRDHLDWIGISIDSLNSETLSRLGRDVGGRTLSERDYESTCRSVREHGMRLKITTTVTRLNAQEDLSEFIEKVRPDRWKILEVIGIEGENRDVIDSLKVSEDVFTSFCLRHEHLKTGTGMVVEDARLLTGSYLMIDPYGRFFDNVLGRFTCSSPILSVGLEAALEEISCSPALFEERGGKYKW